MSAGAELDPAAVEIGSFLAHSPERVWRMLTEPDLIARWLMPATGFAAEVGTHFVFTLPAPYAGEVACEILECRPLERLTVTWVDLRLARPARWVVAWVVEPEGRGSRLMLTHSGFNIKDRREKMARNALDRNWRSCLIRLRAVLDNPMSDGLC